MKSPLELPRSDILKGIDWLTPRIPYPVERVRGDTYPITWAADGELYASSGDPLWGKDLSYSEEVRQDPRIHGLDIERFTGTPPGYKIEKVNEMLDYVGWGGEGPKPTGMISVGGTLYLAAQNLLGKKPPRHGVSSQHGTDAFITASRDLGRTWAPSMAEQVKRGPLFPGATFGGPAFVQYGRDSCAPDGFVYAISTDQWDNGSDLRVGRVRADLILDGSAWEFVAELHGAVSPRWTRRLDDAVSVLTIDRQVSLPEMLMLPGVGRYLLLTWRLHVDFSPDDGSELTVLESPEPWGPFRLVHQDRSWDDGEATFYCPRMPLKWYHGASREGWLLYSGSWFSPRANDPTRPFYRSHVRGFRLR